jgi:phenylalanyl-tRNA synthetase beta chain
MKITYRWLSEMTPVSASPQQLAGQLTMAGLEVESLTAVAPPFTGVVVGEVLESHRHPDAEKLSLCQVTTDGQNRLQIVCGAGNVRAGLKVAVAMVGAKLPNDVSIKRAKLRGQESNGMLCSARELGLGEDHEGIMELDASLPLNQNLREALDLDDTVIEVNATPNRGDCMSVFGIARDYAAAQQRRFLKFQSAPVAAAHAVVFPVTIASPACPIFASRIIRGVRPDARSPEWLRERLRRVGVNSISAIVDVTNYVMMELGQPMHAYDLARLKGGIVVRPAHPAERITLLNDQEYPLDADFLTIADADGAIGVAGIMGGRRTAIADGTVDVLLEAAHFLPSAIAGRARRLGLFTDAAQRFERGVDLKLPAIAVERATALLMACAGGSPGPVQITRASNDGGRDSSGRDSGGGATVGGGFRGQHAGGSESGDRDPVAGTSGGSESGARDSWVALRRSRLARLLGTEIPDAEVHAVLDSISEQVTVTAEGWRARAPSHRFDLRIEADLIEEVARLVGFDRIPEAPAMAPQLAGPATEARVANERLLTAMADRGYREIITYTFVDQALQQQLFPGSPSLALSNPLSADLSTMRVSLWPGLLQTCREQLRRQHSRARLFELGNKFVVERSPAGGGDELHEIETLAGLAAGARWPEQWGSAREPVDFYDVKADLMNVLALTGDTTDVKFSDEALPILRPGRSARIHRGAHPVGWLGELHPQLARTLNLPASTFLFELEVTQAFGSSVIKYKGISKFPSVRRDLAIVIDESVPLAVLQENVTVTASDLLSELRVFDVYRGPGIETGRKSIALGLILQDSSRTLTDVDADAVVTAVVARLRDVLRATIRD